MTWRTRIRVAVQRFFYRLNPEWFKPASVCCRCAAAIRPGGFFAKRKVSHGICGPCVRSAAV